MRLLLASDTSLADYGGVQTYVRQVGDWMERSGHQVAYLSSTQHSAARSEHVYALSMSLGFNGSVASTPIATNLRATRNFVADFKPDVVHVQFPHSPLFLHQVIQSLP